MNRQPLLAIVYSPRSRPWAELVDAASGLCRILWVVDSTQASATVVARALGKFGKVVDIAGCTEQEALQLVHAEHPDGVVSYTDADLHRQAWIAGSLGLVGPSARSAALLTDKLLQREALKAAGVAQPRFAELREPLSAEQVDRLCDAMSFPMLLKPRDGTACRGIRSVTSRDELVRELEQLARLSGWVLEERMADVSGPGSPYADRISVDSIVSGSDISHLGVTGLFAMVPPFRSSGGFFPADVADEGTAEVFALATASIKALGSGSGCYRTEVKLSPEGRKVIEVNGRPTGLTPATVRLASGLPLLELSMRLALGEHVVLDWPLDCNRIAYRYYAEPPMSARRVVSIEGLDRLRHLPGVTQVDLHKQAGETVDWANGSLDKIFQVTGAVADYGELERHYRACSEDVVILYEEQT